MMNRTLLFALLTGTALSMTACVVAPVVPPPGLFYTGYSAPLDVDQAKTPVAEKTGKASSYAVMGLVAWGDASIDAAAKAGGIQTIESADYELTNILLGMYQQYTTVVHGN